MPGQTSGSDAGPVNDSACAWSRGMIHLEFIDRVPLHWRLNHWCIMGWLIGGGGSTADQLMKLPCKKQKEQERNPNLKWWPNHPFYSSIATGFCLGHTEKASRMNHAQAKLFIVFLIVYIANILFVFAGMMWCFKPAVLAVSLGVSCFFSENVLTA